jgi:alanine racemase
MYHHLNTLTIFPERLAHNFRTLSDMLSDVQIVPVVKSNAYGHGIKILAPLLTQHDVPFVCVDSLYEAYELEKFGYKNDVLIMGYVDPRDIPRRRNFIYAVSEFDYALSLLAQYAGARLHLFFDTGMHRE